MWERILNIFVSWCMKNGDKFLLENIRTLKSLSMAYPTTELSKFDKKLQTLYVHKVPWNEFRVDNVKIMLTDENKVVIKYNEPDDSLFDDVLFVINFTGMPIHYYGFPIYYINPRNGSFDASKLRIRFDISDEKYLSFIAELEQLNQNIIRTLGETFGFESMILNQTRGEQNLDIYIKPQVRITPTGDLKYNVCDFFTDERIAYALKWKIDVNHSMANPHKLKVYPYTPKTTKWKKAASIEDFKNNIIKPLFEQISNHPGKYFDGIGMDILASLNINVQEYLVNKRIIVFLRCDSLTYTSPRFSSEDYELLQDLMKK